jgi:predicted AlkP superfamily pyrophosphatase or phosphodiesterase
VKKLVLVVIDAMKPAMLERAGRAGRAPVLKRLMEEGQFVDECVAAFPSVTPCVRPRSPPGRRRTAI